MKYTDKFFKFPVKTYDLYDVIKTEEEEDELKRTTGQHAKIALPFGVIIKAVLPEDIIEYNESCGKEDDLQESTQHGFPNTAVITKRDGVFECIWTMKKFEEKLNAHMEKIEKSKNSSFNSINNGESTT